MPKASFVSTSDMPQTSGPLIRPPVPIAENRDGRFFVVPGYVKSLVEDGFRTYGGTGASRYELHCTQHPR